MADNQGQNQGGSDPASPAGAVELRTEGAGEAALLVTMDAVLVGRVAWAIDRIADHCWLPKPPPELWAGRQDLIALITLGKEDGGLALSREEASLVVDQAALKLWAREAEDPAHVRKELMRMRIISIRQLALKLIRDGRTETTVKFEENPDPRKPNTVIEVPVKAKKFKGAGPAEIGLLLSIERMLAELDGIQGPASNTNVNIVATIFRELEKASDARVKVTDRASLAQQLMGAPIDGSSRAGMAKIHAAIQELNSGGRAKKVTSTVHDAEKGPGTEAE